MSKTLEQLNEIITSSTIPLADQNDLLIFLPILPEETLKELCQLWQKHKKLVNDFNDNFKAKLNILINGRDKWEKLISQEEAMLNEEFDEEDKNNEDEF
ncbi:MAG: hypothetical protein PHE59_03335 [Patescibacteria group bacterium]|nr:hypothetical protein [Patescibacteria group bacterium]MDD5164468.1 hypothetical protein [Patescibacteria group bacterium]MDD5534387.1 hypothetical protein [Patescibacteria group bacterium]